MFAVLLFKASIIFAQGGTTGPLTWQLSGVAPNMTLTITGSGAMPNYSSQTNVPWNSYMNAIQTVELGSGVTHIGNYAFSNCSSLPSINISNVTTIGNYAFQYCSSLNPLTIPNGVTSIGFCAFRGCTSLATVSFNATNCTTMSANTSYPVFEGCTAFTTLNIGNNVTRIPSTSFYGCNKINSVITMPGVTSIGTYAFYNCSLITTVNLPSAVTSIGNYTFYGCGALNSINISSIATIGDYAFSDCSSISTVTIPNGITSIGNNAFRNCTSLATVNFNATNCTTMGSSTSPVFQGCSVLTRINVGDNVTRAPANAFRNCTNMQNIYSYRTILPPIAVSNSTFYGINKTTCILHVPTGTQGAYAAADGWSEFFNIIEDAVTQPHTISGQVTYSGNPLSGVNMAYTGGSTTTNGSGQYTITVEAGATVTITPSLAGYTFTPPSITCTNVTSNLTNQNFTAQVTFVPVTNITGVPTTATATIPLALIGTVVPGNATNQTITWSIQNAGTTGATITGGNMLNTTNSGTAVVQAIVVNGASPTTNYTQNCTITVNKAVLGGTVSITGNTVFGQTLTANPNLSSTPVIGNLGTLSYQWRRGGTNISGATSSTYTLVQADIDNVINVVVSAANCSGTVTSANTATITKATQTAPVAPTMQNHTPTSITLNSVSGCEYNINGGAYQSSATFGGLTPNTSYTFTQRKAETATHLASPASPTAQFSTQEGTAPILGGTVSITGNTVFGQTLTAATNLTSNPSTGDLGEIFYQWKRSGTPVGANAPTYILVEEDISHTMTVTVTAANCTGNVTSNPTATVTKTTQTAPAAPTLNSTAPTSITLNIVSGCEYNINGGAWQESPTFSGLTPNTSYAFAQRKAETTTHFASPSSVPANFTTDNTTVPLYTIVSSVNNPAFGTITPYGENMVEEGNALEFTITPYTGYIIESVMINGINHGAIYSYTFENVREHGTISVVFVGDVGIVETGNAPSIRIYPNPVNEQLTIDNGELTIKNVQIFDVMGRCVATVETGRAPSLQSTSSETTINVSHLPSGIYFLKIGEMVAKFVKE